MLGADHPELADTLSDLGVLYSQEGRYEKAGTFFRRALAINEKGREGKDGQDWL
jgi:hypothetical protein